MLTALSSWRTLCGSRPSCWYVDGASIAVRRGYIGRYWRPNLLHAPRLDLFTNFMSPQVRIQALQDDASAKRAETADLKRQISTKEAKISDALVVCDTNKNACCTAYKLQLLLQTRDAAMNAIDMAQRGLEAAKTARASAAQAAKEKLTFTEIRLNNSEQLSLEAVSRAQAALAQSQERVAHLRSQIAALSAGRSLAEHEADIEDMKESQELLDAGGITLMKRRLKSRQDALKASVSATRAEITRIVAQRMEAEKGGRRMELHATVMREALDVMLEAIKKQNVTPELISTARGALTLEFPDAEVQGELEDANGVQGGPVSPDESTGRSLIEGMTLKNAGDASRMLPPSIGEQDAATRAILAASSKGGSQGLAALAASNMDANSLAMALASGGAGGSGRGIKGSGPGGRDAPAKDILLSDSHKAGRGSITHGFHKSFQEGVHREGQQLYADSTVERGGSSASARGRQGAGTSSSKRQSFFGAFSGIERVHSAAASAAVQQARQQHMERQQAALDAANAKLGSGTPPSSRDAPPPRDNIWDGTSPAPQQEGSPRRAPPRAPAGSKGDAGIVSPSVDNPPSPPPMRSAETQDSLRARQKRAARGSMLRDQGNLWGKFRETAQARHEREKARAAKEETTEKKRTSPTRKVKEAKSLVGEYIRAAPGVAPRRSITANLSFNPSVLRALAEQSDSSDNEGEEQDSFPRPAGSSTGGSTRSSSPLKSPPAVGAGKGGSPAARIKPIRRNSNLLRGTASFGAPASSPNKSEKALPTQFEVSPGDSASPAEGGGDSAAQSPEPATTRAAERRAAARRTGGGSTWNNSTNPTSVSTTSKAGISRATGPQALAAALRSSDSAEVEAARAEMALRQAARKRAKAVGDQAKRIAEMRARRMEEANPRSAAVWAEANVSGFGGPASPPMDGREIGRMRDMAGNDAAPPLHTGDAHTPYTHVEGAHFASFRGDTPGSPTSPRRRPPGAASDHHISEAEAEATASAMGGAPEWNPYFQHRKPGTVNMSRRFQYDKHVHEPQGSPFVGPTLMQKVEGTSMEGYLMDAKAARMADAAAKGARVQYSMPGSAGSTGRFSPPRLANGSPAGSTDLGSSRGSSQVGAGGSAQPPMGASGTLSEGSTPQLAPPPPPGTRWANDAPAAADSPPSQGSAAATTPGGSSLLEMLASGNVPRELLSGDSDSEGETNSAPAAAAAGTPPPPPPGVTVAPGSAPKRPPPATPPTSGGKAPPS